VCRQGAVDGLQRNSFGSLHLWQWVNSNPVPLARTILDGDFTFEENRTPRHFSL